MSKAETLCKCEITPEFIGREVLHLLSGWRYWEFEGKDAEKLSTYTAGAVDLANALIERYEGRPAE